jgi:hypothetical protein
MIIKLTSHRETIMIGSQPCMYLLQNIYNVCLLWVAGGAGARPLLQRAAGHPLSLGALPHGGQGMGRAQLGPHPRRRLRLRVCGRGAPLGLFTYNNCSWVLHVATGRCTHTHSTHTGLFETKMLRPSLIRAHEQLYGWPNRMRGGEWWLYGFFVS